MSAMNTAEKELLQFLQGDSVPATLRKTALEYVLGLTASENGQQFLISQPEYLRIIVSLLKVEQDPHLYELAHKCLINISCSAEGTAAVFAVDEQCFLLLCNALASDNVLFIHLKCQILANVTRSPSVCNAVANYLSENFQVFENLLLKYNASQRNVRETFDYMALVFGNLSTDEEGKRIFLLKGKQHLKSLFVYTMYQDSEIRRIGTAILLKNICWETHFHKMLLEELEILPSLLFPLIGPEDLEEDEMEKLPVICQFLGEDKKREHNHLIRILLLEALFKMCSTKYGRNYLRDSGVYYVLRELHKWEPEAVTSKVCEDVVEILIRDEPDIGAENLIDVIIPEHLTKQLNDLTLANSELPQIIT